jgi:hypothetical protein
MIARRASIAKSFRSDFGSWVLSQLHFKFPITLIRNWPQAVPDELRLIMDRMWPRLVFVGEHPLESAILVAF